MIDHSLVESLNLYSDDHSYTTVVTVDEISVLRCIKQLSTVIDRYAIVNNLQVMI